MYLATCIRLSGAEMSIHPEIMAEGFNILHINPLGYCTAADVPFLTHFPRAIGRGAYEIASRALDEAEDKERAWKALGYIDTMSHVHRLTMPVLLTAGSDDEMCPPETIEGLFSELPRTRSLTYIRGREHAYTPEFLFLAKAWFRMYA